MVFGKVIEGMDVVRKMEVRQMNASLTMIIIAEGMERVLITIHV